MKITPNEEYYYVEAGEDSSYIFLKNKKKLDKTASLYIYGIKTRGFYYNEFEDNALRICPDRNIKFIRPANSNEIKLLKSKITEYKKSINHEI